VVSLLREKGVGNVLVFGGGIIPADDIPVLRDAGVAAVFTPGAPLSEIVGWLEQALDARESQMAS
jgi:methylmalonyl-CoA mutase C-terminal domain/subunit